MSVDVDGFGKVRIDGRNKMDEDRDRNKVESWGKLDETNGGYIHQGRFHRK